MRRHGKPPRETRQLGPFILVEQIGAGGMGEVWRARHRDTDERVAVKVMTAEQATEESYRRKFLTEVRALAKLHHPSVASIVDFGSIPAGMTGGAANPLDAGAPWYAMEYVDGPDLGESGLDWDWPDLRSALLSILDGLAHIHARGIVHRDLKLSNVMVERGAPPTRAVRLVDFGIAAVAEPADEVEAIARETMTGTPRYMAPEQIGGIPVDQGPWTDLYALGCLTWRFVCREAPYDGQTIREILAAHLEGRRAEFAPEMAVPDGLEEWLEGLLEGEPSRRTARASDAAWQLMQLGRAEAQQETRQRRRTTSLGAHATTRAIESDDRRGASRSTDWLSHGRESLPPVPDTWQRGRSLRTRPMPRAGLQLFSLREVPMVDRDAARDLLWRKLKNVDEDGQARAVFLEGPAGRGKSRLAEWFARRVDEVGAARTIRAIHSEQGGRNHGLVGMFRRFFGGERLGRADFYERLRQRKPPLRSGDPLGSDDRARALTELVYPTDGDGGDGPSYTFAGPEHRRAVVVRTLDALCRRRPLVVWLDDLQWSSFALEVLDDIWQRRADPLAVLFVGTVRSETMAQDDRRLETYERLADRPGMERVPLEPLERRDHRRLIRSMLDLEPALVDSLAERTEGNPLFARQLLGHWVATDVLEAGPRGFRVPEGRQAELPDDIDALWLERVDRLLEAFAPGEAQDVLESLEIAAVLGRDVDLEEWDVICRRSGVEIPSRLVGELIERGLVAATSDGVSFAHGLLVESLAERARSGGSWRTHHRRCARGIEEMYGDGHAAMVERRADHWMAAEAWERALEPLLQLLYRLDDIGDYRRMSDVLDRREEAIERMDAEVDAETRLEQDLLRSWCGFQRGSAPEPALAEAERIAEGAREAGIPRLIVRAKSFASVIERRSGDLREALATAREAMLVARKHGDKRVLSRALRRLYWCQYYLGDCRSAADGARERRELAGEMGDTRGELQSRRDRALFEAAAGDDERARQTIRDVLDAAEARGFRGLVASCVNLLGEHAKFAGDYDEARQHFARYRELSSELGSMSSTAVGELNLGMVELKQRRWDRAAEQFEKTRILSERDGFGFTARYLEVGGLVLAAGRGNWSEFDRLVASYADGWPADAMVEEDFPWLLETAADLAEEAGYVDRRRRALNLAIQLWDRLERPEKAEFLRERLSKTRGTE